MGLTGVFRAERRFDAAARIGVAIGLGFAGERLLYDAPVGWLYAVFVTALLSATVILNGANGFRSISLLLAIAGIVALIVEPHWASFLLAFLGVASVALSAQANVARDAWNWMRHMANFTLMLPGALIASVMGGSSKLRVPSFPISVATVARQWIIPLMLASLFLILFLIGNPLMLDGATSIFNFFIGGTGFSLFDLIMSALRITVIALLCLPFLSIPKLEISYTEPSLASVLWGGGVLPEDMTLSEYAHQGTYPLAIAAVLVGAFVILMMPAGGEAEKNRKARTLAFLWIAQTGFLAASCLKRMDMYVSAYSLTYLRVIAIFAITLITIGLIWIVVRVALKRSNRWLITVSTLTALALLFLGSVVDIGARIAWYNVEHSREIGGEGVRLDVAYLRKAIGPSAIPALAWYIDNRRYGVDPMRRQTRSDRAINARDALTQQFSETMTDTRGWTLRRHWLQQQIAQLE